IAKKRKAFKMLGIHISSRSVDPICRHLQHIPRPHEDFYLVLLTEKGWCRRPPAKSIVKPGLASAASTAAVLLSRRDGSESRSTEFWSSRGQSPCLQAGGWRRCRQPP